MRIVYPLLWATVGRQACQEQAINTVAALARRGHDLTLLMPQARGDADLSADDLRAYYRVEGDFRLVQRPSRWAGERVGRTLMWLHQVFRDPELRGADLMLSRTPVMFGTPVLPAIPFATDHYRPWSDEVPALRPFFRRNAHHRLCAGLIIHSHFAAGAYRRAGIDEGRILVAHNGAPPPAERLDKEAARARLGLPAARPIALYAGRLNGEKGLDQLLAMAALRPEILFVLVGSEGEGPIEREAARSDNVRIFPWATPEVLPVWLQAADILLIPPSRAPLKRFRRSVLPMKLFAYLAAGRPILAPQSPDTAELLEHEATGLLVPPDCPAAAAAALDRLLADDALAARLSNSALQLSADLSWDRRAEKISAFLQMRLTAIAEAAAQRSAYRRTVTPISAAMSGAVHAPTSGGREPTCAATVSSPSPTR